MQTITLIGQKGGTGKTTITTGLAVAATLAGFKAVIFDTDPQQSAKNWHKRRGAATAPQAFTVAPAELPAKLDAARAAGVDFVFIDTAGKLADRPNELAPSAIEAARLADLVLIPVRQQVFEIETLYPARAVIEAAGHPQALVIVNGAHPSAKNPTDDMGRITASAFGLPVASAYLCHRAAYANAPTKGQGPQEIDPEGKAAQEIAALFDYLRHTFTQTDNATTIQEARNA